MVKKPGLSGRVSCKAYRLLEGHTNFILISTSVLLRSWKLVIGEKLKTNASNCPWRITRFSLRLVFAFYCFVSCMIYSSSSNGLVSPATTCCELTAKSWTLASARWAESLVCSSPGLPLRTLLFYTGLESKRVVFFTSLFNACSLFFSASVSSPAIRPALFAFANCFRSLRLRA